MSGSLPQAFVMTSNTYKDTFRLLMGRDKGRVKVVFLC